MASRNQVKYSVVIAAALAALLAIAGCSSSSDKSNPTTTPTVTTASPRQVTITQPNDGPQPVVDFINTAKKTLDFALYEFDSTYEPIVQAAQAAKQRGVVVRVMLSATENSPTSNGPIPSKQNATDVAAFTKLGFQAKLSNSKDFAWYHQKTIIVDGAEADGKALIMDFNLAASYLTVGASPYDANEGGTRGMAAIDMDPADVKNIQQTFDADFSQVPWAGSTRPNLVWAPAGSNYRPRGNAITVFQNMISKATFQNMISKATFQNMISKATKTIDAYIQVFNYETTSLTLPYLLDAAKRGVQIRIITNKNAFTRQAAYTQLKAAGAQIVMQPSSYADPAKYFYIHCKSVVVDAGQPNQVAFVGSENPFLNDSLNKERELGVLVQDPGSVNFVMTTFNRDFEASNPYMASSTPPTS